MTAARLTASVAAALVVLIQGAAATPVLAQGYPQTVDAQSFYRSQSSGESQAYQAVQAQTAGRYWTRETRTVVDQRPVVHRLIHSCGCHLARPARHVTYARTARTETVWVEHDVAAPPPPAPPPPSDEVGYIPASFFADEGGVGPYPADYGGGGGGYVYGGGAADARASASASVEASIAISGRYRGGRGRGGWGPMGGGHGGGCGCKK